jgi:hypothetical protein
MINWSAFSTSATLRYQPCSSQVLMRWQLAHLTKHFSISFAIVPQLHGLFTITVIAAFLSRWWSNSNNRISLIPQSIHGCVAKYARTLRRFSSLFPLLATWYFFGFFRYEPMLKVEQHSLQYACKPSRKEAFLLKWERSFIWLHRLQSFRYLEVNYGKVI